MLLFVILGTMTALALALLVPPLLRRGREPARRADYDVEIYRHQLDELDRDVERGLISSEEAETARLEVERRMLAATATETAVPPRETPASPALIAAFAIVVGLPLAAGSLYLWMGSPGLESRPFAERQTAASESVAEAPDIEGMVARLAERLRSEPDNLEGWLMLARSYGVLERYEEGITALEHALRLTNRDPNVLAMLGEFHILAADGVVTPKAAALLSEALAADPKQTVPRYYAGLAKAQAGDVRGALDDWLALERDSPADAPYLATLRAGIDKAARALGVDVATLDRKAPKAAAPAGPTPADIENARGMSANEQSTMIRGMVTRLAERLRSEPDDLAGWMRLGRSYAVLGEAGKSRDAYAKAATLAPDDAEVLAAYVTAIVAADPGNARLSSEAVRVARHLGEIDTDNRTALWLLGRAEAEGGNPDAARKLWRRLLAQLPPDGPDHAAISRAIDSLGKAAGDG
ncbi:MAG: c-type cytochrome biogenesis protein CcmI [Alphaproteobacteria bacterium]